MALLLCSNTTGALGMKPLIFSTMLCNSVIAILLHITIILTWLLSFYISVFLHLHAVTNNICGPAMMGLPAIYRAAGLLPTTVCIILVFLCSSLTGSLLSESIQRLNNNKNFDKNIDFPRAFSEIVGHKWHMLVEVLVIISCSVNACAGIVETAQSLDSFLASFVLGKTWGLGIPSMSLIEWDSSSCISAAANGGHDSKLSSCTPFHHNKHDSIISLGYLITTLAFYPLGRHDLKETIVVQIISFLCFFLLIGQFLHEFSDRGFSDAATVPYIGSDMSQLAGVVLFNYAYPITIPSWLNEKKPSVPVNSIIWSASSISTVLYIVFGVLGACSFANTGDDMLILLASNQVSYLTRISAAFFGVLIIGAGVPIFCVIVKNSLATAKICNHDWSLFFGATLPYLVSWLMYQGTLLLTVVNWTGLVVNGSVAFILPLVLAYCAISYNSSSTDVDDIELQDKSTLNQYKYESINTNVDDADTAGGVTTEDEEKPSWVKPFPQFLESSRQPIILFAFFCFTTIVVGTIFLDLFTGAAPP